MEQKKTKKQKNNKWELWKEAVKVKTIFLPKIKLSIYSTGGKTNSIMEKQVHNKLFM